jgi:DNA-binding HxlR family transcriptional regulator
MENNRIIDPRMVSLTNSMTILTGKWKLHILGTLLYGGKMRFMDLEREIEGIKSRMLSKELQLLEKYNLISRVIKSEKPIIVEYELTEFGKSLEPFIDSIAQWGIDYRTSVIGPKEISDI